MESQRFEVRKKSPMQVLILMGTAGCGKSSIGQEIQKLLNCDYLEGDSLHPKENVDKMSRGEPLDDADRWPWLGCIRNKVIEITKNYHQQNVDSETEPVVIVTCSALRKVYRDFLRDIPPADAMVTFVYLKGSKELLSERISNRQGHFMASSMLESQLRALEEPNPDEEQIIVADIHYDPPFVARNVVEDAKSRNILSLQNKSRI